MDISAIKGKWLIIEHIPQDLKIWNLSKRLRKQKMKTMNPPQKNIGKII